MTKINIKFVFLGSLVVVKDLIEHGNLQIHTLRKVVSQLKKLSPKTEVLRHNKKKTTEEKIREETAIQNKWNVVLQFLECFESKKAVDKCMY